MNSYSQALNFLFEELPYYQTKGKKSIKLDLSKIELFSKELNYPHNNIKTIHVAGTNGKGSVTHIIASILQSKGLKVGIYSSPHLIDFRERIKINGNYISEEYVLEFVNSHFRYMKSKNLSFFEMTVGLAFDYFYNQKVDIAVIEVGMGGRLDATNIITPEISIITNIGLDHTEFLGNSLSKIAFEKAGIIKSGVPVLIGEFHPDTASVFKTKANELGSEIYFAQMPDKRYETDLIPNYQQTNINTAINAIKILSNYDISDDEINSAIKKIKKQTYLIGRWDYIDDNPKTIIDVTHNIEGFNLMLEQLENENFDNLHLVLGFVKEKDVKAIFEILPKKAFYYLCSPTIERGIDLNELSNIAKSSNLNFKIYPSVKKALESAKFNSRHNDLIVISGSTFVVAEIM